MKTLGIDFETYSDVDLKAVGTSRYARDPTTEVLMAAYTLDGARTVKQWIPAEGQEMPAELEDALLDSEVEKQAFNAAFEMAILQDTLKMPVDVRQWRCTMVIAMTCALPGSLERLGPVVGIDEEHLKAAKDGKRLMRKFSFPRKPTKTNPSTRLHWYDDLDEWEKYLHYNRQDVVAEQAILRRIRKYSPPPEEWEMWHIDQEINRAGVPINLNMVRNAVRVYEHIMAEDIAELKSLTGLKNPNSGPQMLAWLRDAGYPYEDLRKAHVEQARQAILERVEASGNDFAVIYENQEYLRAIELRQRISRTSVKKFHAFERATDDDGYLRYTLQFAAAGRTWRWGGRTGQLQNVARPDPQFEDDPETHARNVENLTAPELALIYGKDNLFDLLASTIRPSIQAPPGYVLLDADLSAIENIMLGWVSGCEKILSVFERNRDPYLSFGAYLFGRDYQDLLAEYRAGNKSSRTIAKPGALGCGYMMGAGETRINPATGEVEATGLLGYAWNMGVRDFTQADSKRSVDVFRGTYTEVTDFWYGIDRAVRRCMRKREPVEFGPVVMDIEGPFMRIRLPSGRYLRYTDPQLIIAKTPWGEKRLTPSYMGVNDRRQWARITSHPGKWTENCWAADTLVLTDGGIKRIVEVTTADRVWDGRAWVTHNGVAQQGERHVIDLAGARVTPEHRIEVDGVWVEAGSISADAAASSYERHYGGATRAALHPRETRFGWTRHALAGRLRLWFRDRAAGVRLSASPILRVLVAGAAPAGEPHSRTNARGDLFGVAQHVGSMREPEASGMGAIRRAWNRGVRTMGEVREFLCRHGADLSERADDRADRQQRGVSSAELSMGHPESAGPEYAEQSRDRHAAGEDVARGSGRGVGDRQNDAVVSGERRMARSGDVSTTGHAEQVFDLLNCGPHHAFTVVLPDGRLILAHNCVQAVSRDILARGIKLARQNGLDTRLHVHDQQVALIREEDAEEGLKLLIECMSDAPEWGKDIPLRTAGFVSPVWIKD